MFYPVKLWGHKDAESHQAGIITDLPPEKKAYSVSNKLIVLNLALIPRKDQKS